MSQQPPPDPYPGSQPPTGWQPHPSPYSHPYPYGTPYGAPYGTPYGGQYPHPQPGYLPPIYPQPPPQLTVGEVLRSAWAAFVSRIKEYLIVALGFGLVLGTLGVVVLVGFFGMIGTSDSETGTPKAGPTALLVAVIILFYLVAGVGAVMLQIFETRIALAAVDGEVQLGLGDLLRQGLRRFWPFVGWMLLSTLLQFAVVCIPFGSVVVQFFLLFVPLIVLDHPRMEGLNPLKASYESVKAQAGNLILVFLVVQAIAIPLMIVALPLMFFVPVAGFLIAGVGGMLYSAFGRTAYAVVYRASPLGGGIGAGPPPGGTVAAYQPYPYPDPHQQNDPGKPHAGEPPPGGPHPGGPHPGGPFGDQPGSPPA